MVFSQICYKSCRLNDGVIFNSSKILSVLCDGIFDGGPRPVFSSSLRNFESSFVAVLCKFVHFSLTSLALQYAVPMAFEILFPHTLLYFVLFVFVLINFNFGT